MNLSAPAAKSLTPRAPSPDGLGGLRSEVLSSQSDFARTLARAQPSAAAAKDPAEMRKAAEDFVAIALVQPILKQLRESDATPPPLGPGPGEKQFRQLADAQVSRQIVRSGNWPLIDSMVKVMNARVSGAEPQVLPGSPADVKRRGSAQSVEVR